MHPARVAKLFYQKFAMVFLKAAISEMKLPNIKLRLTKLGVLNRRLRWPRHIAPMEQTRNAYRVLVGKPEGKRRLGRPRRRWVDNIKMNLREVGCGPGDWIALAEHRDQWRAYVRAVMNLRVP